MVIVRVLSALGLRLYCVCQDIRYLWCCCQIGYLADLMNMAYLLRSFVNRDRLYELTEVHIYQIIFNNQNLGSC